MILKMEKLSVFGLLSDKDAVVNELMRARCIQVKSADSMDDYDELKDKTQSCPADVYQAEARLGKYTAALSSISFFMPKAGMFAKRPRVLFDRLEDVAMMSKAQELCEGIERVNSEISDLRGAKSKDMFQRSSLEPWQESDLPLEVTATEQINLQHYLLPSKIDMQAFAQKADEAAPASLFSVVSQDREQQYVVVYCHKTQESPLWEVLKEYGATKVNFSGLSGSAGDNVRALDESILRKDSEIASCEERLRALAAEAFPIKYAIDALSVDIQRGKATDHFLTTQKTFCFSAWVPENAKEATLSILEKYGCYYELTQCADDEEAPILLKNSVLVEPYETITQMYSLPSYHGFDPNLAMAPFFFIFFGMMFSDAGYGIVLTLACWFILKKMDIAPGGGKLFKVLFWGGISTIIWGAVFGSWFGDIFTVVGDVFLGREIVVPKLLDPLGDPMTIMVLSMALGIIHLFVGMGLKAYLLIKRGHPWEALSDVGFWYMVIIGLLMLLAPGIFSKIGLYMAVIGAVGLILTQGRDKKNPFMRIISGVMSLYDITGYFSDVLSYSRILALGLATGVIASVINIMGTLMGANVLGVIMLIVIFIFGHLLNFTINGLGAYVHTSRLQYVEFFGKFYEAGGKPFIPLAANTKYITVLNKEENV